MLRIGNFHIPNEEVMLRFERRPEDLSIPLPGYSIPKLGRRALEGCGGVSIGSSRNPDQFGEGGVCCYMVPHSDFDDDPIHLILSLISDRVWGTLRMGGPREKEQGSPGVSCGTLQALSACQDRRVGDG